VKYALLIYANQSAWEQFSFEERAQLRAEQIPDWIAAMEELGKADPDMKGYELDEGKTAKVVRVRDGEPIITDGPFAETKEIIGGLFVLDLPDLDEAIRMASLVPTAKYGSLEIRPIVE
jgi:hypothetical protein